MRRQDIRELVVAFVSNIGAGIVTFFVLEDPLLTGLVVLITVLCTIFALLFLRVDQIRKTVMELKEESSLRPPECCGLHIAGFSQVFEKANQSLRLTVELASRSYKFLGVSAQFVLGTQDFRELVRRKTQQEGCHFQILLLNPDSEEILERHATLEGSTKEAVSFDIRHSIASLRQLAKECNGKLEVWLYRDLPLFRLVLVDDERVFVNFYGAKGQMGFYALR